MNKKIAMIGCGKLAAVISGAVRSGFLPGYEVAAAMSHKKADAQAFCEIAGGKAVDTLQELLAEKPDFVLEIASVACVKEYCIPVLESGASFIPLSIGAFADNAFYEKAKQTALESGARLYIPHGAVGGFDVLSTLALMAQAQQDELHVDFCTRKGPNPLKKTSLYREEMEQQETVAFSGTCAQAIELLPTQVNVAIAQSLTTVGPEKAMAKITAIPGFVGDEHTITAEMNGLKVVSQVYSANAQIAAWSIVSLLRSLSSPVNFF